MLGRIKTNQDDSAQVIDPLQFKYASIYAFKLPTLVE
jgi:hypothetical protein